MGKKIPSRSNSALRIYFSFLLFAQMINITKRLCHKYNLKYGTFINCTRAIISRGLYIYYPIFHCGFYCRAVSNRDNFCNKQVSSSIFGPKIRDYNRMGYKDLCTVSTLLNVKLMKLYSLDHSGFLKNHSFIDCFLSLSDCWLK